MLLAGGARGVGETPTLIEANGSATCVGYATFVERYDRRFAPLLGGFEANLGLPEMENSLRLVEIRDALARLVHQLDEEQRYVEGQIGYTTWLGFSSRITMLGCVPASSTD